MPVSAAEEPQQTVYESLPSLMESDLSRVTIGWTNYNVPANQGSVVNAPNALNTIVNATGKYRLEIRRPISMSHINVGIQIGNYHNWVFMYSTTDFEYTANQGQQLQIKFSTNSTPGTIQYRIIRIA